MRNCPLCKRQYDDTWSVCLYDENKLLEEGQDITGLALKKKSQFSGKVLGGFLMLIGSSFLYPAGIGFVAAIKEIKPGFTASSGAMSQINLGLGFTFMFMLMSLPCLIIGAKWFFKKPVVESKQVTNSNT